MDATALKGEFEGVLTAITTANTNDKLDLVAVGVTAKENADSYWYVLEHAIKNPGKKSFLIATSTTCFTDWHRGSIHTLAYKAPLTEHRR